MTEAARDAEKLCSSLHGRWCILGAGSGVWGREGGGRTRGGEGRKGGGRVCVLRDCMVGGTCQWPGVGCGGGGFMGLGVRGRGVSS